MGLVEQDVISLANFTVLCWPLSVCILFLPTFPPCVSFAKRLLPAGLGDSFTWNGYSWRFIIVASTHQELGLRKPRHCVRRGLILERNFVMPFSSLYLPKWRFFLPSVESRCGARLHHYSAASREFLSGELFLSNLESLQTMWKQIAGYSHSGLFKVCHMFEKYPSWLLRRVVHLSSSTIWLWASVSSCLLLRGGGFRRESPIGRQRPIELWIMLWTWWVRSCF